MAQLVKNLPPVQDTWVQFLGWEDPLEEKKATCWGPAPAGSRGILRMNSVSERERYVGPCLDLSLDRAKCARKRERERERERERDQTRNVQQSLAVAIFLTVAFIP